MTTEEFEEIVIKESDKKYGLCSPPISAERGLDILIEHFLGKDWYVMMPLSKEQVYTEAIYEIIKRNKKRK